MELALETRSQGTWTVVRVAGELDMHTSPQIREEVLARATDGDRRIALDLTEVSFMDSSSLGVLVMCLKRLREQDGRLVLVGVRGSPMKVLVLTGLDRVFDIFDTAAELPSD